MMKRLIVNADDLGADEARNAGIFDGITAGSITSASILANGPAFEDAVRRIRKLGRVIVSFGVHLNLSEGKPLVSGLRQLVRPDGNFRGKAEARRLLLQRGNPEMEEEIRREIAAQILRMRANHIPVTHMDGHQHVHVFPAVAALAAAAAKMYGIPWVRIPSEPCCAAAEWISAAQEEEVRLFSGSAESARPCFLASGLYGTDHFRGLYLKGRLPELNWMEFLASLPDGITELMVHPGHVPAAEGSGPFAGFSTIERERELEALINIGFHTALRETGVELRPFPEQPPALFFTN